MNTLLLLYFIILILKIKNLKMIRFYSFYRFSYFRKIRTPTLICGLIPSLFRKLKERVTKIVSSVATTQTQAF